MKVIILGEGKWGLALKGVLEENNQEVYVWSGNGKIEEANVYVICLPVQVIRPCLEIAKINNKKNVMIVNGSKGIEKDTNKLPYQIIREIVGKKVDYFCLSGPSFASELTAKMPTIVNLGYEKKNNLDLIKDLFKTKYFRIKPTKGINLLELAGALKNVYAIMAGVADGLGYGCNTRTLISCMAFEEIRRIIKFKEEVIPATIGDLFLTCNSVNSRNYQFGRMLAKEKIKDILGKIDGVVEGLQTIESVKKYNKPLLNFVGEIIKADNPENIREKFEKFLELNL